MIAVDQTGSGQVDLVESAGSGYPAEQRGWTEPAVPVALTVAVRVERKAAVARVDRVAQTGAALAELAVQLRVVQVVPVAQVAWVAQTAVAQAARS